MSTVITTPLLFEGSEWDFDTLRRTYDTVHEIGVDELGLDIYPNQIEVITAEQMLDAYSSIGMPLMYKHWSFGKRFARDETLYRKGVQGLAYEIVINSNPCISYLMEENSIAMQAIVLAHAAIGHNHFFKSNYLFQQWTDADGMLDYLAFAKGFLQRCEERHGLDAVEATLDAAHTLMSHGVNRYIRRKKPNLHAERQRQLERIEYQRSIYNDVWRTVPKRGAGEREDSGPGDGRRAEERRSLGLPEENILYFLEKFAPKLEDWQREILRIVRNISQYFYPQKQTKVMNEGCASFVHYEIMNRLYERALVNDGSMLEFLRLHSAVVFQPEFDDRRYSGINPYALGFGMMRDIKRICQEPTPEDQEWFPDFAGNDDFMGVLKDAWANFRDESFVLQYLSPRLIREMQLFKIVDDASEPTYLVDRIHDDRGYRAIRQTLAKHYDIAWMEPDIQISDVNLKGDRRLVLTHTVRNGVLLDKAECDRVLAHLAYLWGYRVKLQEIDAASDQVLKEHTSVPLP